MAPLLPPPDADLLQQAPVAYAQRETAAALYAFQWYLDLPPPRDLKQLVGKRPVGRNGLLGRALTHSTLQRWRQVFRWIERAEQHDHAAVATAQQKLVAWRAAERIRREKLRLAGADVQRMGALGLLTYEEGEVDPYGQKHSKGEVKPLRDVEARYLEIAGTYLKQAAETERLDLGEPTVRTETNQNVTVTQEQVHVLNPDQLTELRTLVHSLPKVDPQLVIDGHVNPDGTIPAHVQAGRRNRVGASNKALPAPVLDGELAAAPDTAEPALGL